MSTKKQTNKIKGFNLKTDMPLVLLIVLAAISVPRIVAHDLDLVSLESGWYTVMAVLPLAIYLAIALFRKNKRPLYDFMVLGLFFGLFLAITHQITWDASWGDNPPEIGGNLKDTFSPTIESLILRFFAFNSSVFTGLAIGAIFGAVALIAQQVRLRLGQKN